MEPLTHRQLEVLNYISDFRTGRGGAPTLREIAAAFGVSVPRVQQYLAALKKKGYGAGEHYARRGIKLAAGKKEWKVRQAWQGDFDKRIGARLRGETDLSKVIAVVREDLRAWLDVARADLYVYDPGRRELLDSAFYEAAPTGAPAVRAPVAEEESLVGKAFRRRKAVVESGPPAAAAVPVPGRDRPLGILRLESRDPAEAFDDARLTRAGLAAAALAPALEQGALHADLQRRIRLQAALVDLVRTVNSVGDFQRVLREVNRIVNTLVDATLFLVAVRGEEGKWWMLMETDEGADGSKIEKVEPRLADIRENDALKAIRTQPYWIRHRTPEEIRKLEDAGPEWSESGLTGIGYTERRSRSILYVPLRAEGKFVGYLSAQCYHYNAYTIRDAEDLALISEYLGLAIRGAWREEFERARKEKERKRLDRLEALEADLKKIPKEDREAARGRLEKFAKELGLI